MMLRSEWCPLCLLLFNPLLLLLLWWWWLLCLRCLWRRCKSLVKWKVWLARVKTRMARNKRAKITCFLIFNWKDVLRSKNLLDWCFCLVYSFQYFGESMSQKSGNSILRNFIHMSERPFKIRRRSLLILHWNLSDLQVILIFFLSKIQ